MPSSSAVHEQLTRIIVQVVGCEPQAVVPAARLNKDLGVDSLSIVEVVEALGEAFDIYIPDETVNTMITVQDAVNSVVHHDSGANRPSATVPTAAGLLSSRREARPLPAGEIERRKHAAWKLAGWFVVVGLALGAVLGLGGAALINATGMKDVSIRAQPTPSKSATTPTPTPTPSSKKSATTKPKPTLSTATTNIAPGEKLRMNGAFPALDEGATLQVQVKDPGGAWDDFPVTSKTSDGGKYATLIYTTRTGERQIRMLHKATDTVTPAITITVG
ncbi:MAG: acyl carrier protein [Kineosporiaceae bacterium]|nr:acyl carrier protein [Aeromicrobium sp.]